MIGKLGDYVLSVGLGITQIFGYGTLMYSYAVLLPQMAADLSLSQSTAFGILALGFLIGRFMAPLAGTLVDHYGGRYVMTAGSVAAGMALMLLSQVEGRLRRASAGLFRARCGRPTGPCTHSRRRWPRRPPLATGPRRCRLDRLFSRTGRQRDSTTFGVGTAR